MMSGFAANPGFLDSRIGYTAILHTWGQNLQYHPHLHLVVPAGGMTRNDKWKPSKGGATFLFPVEQLSLVFRAKMVEALRAYVRKKQIATNPGLFNSLFEKPWVVCAKPPFAGPKQVLAYLGRYTHRVAISNTRILHVDNSKVTFAWRNYHQDNRMMISTIDGTDFLKRFCLHILPLGFTRIRHYGFLSSAAKTKVLSALREYFCITTCSASEASWQGIARERMGIEAQCCAKCGQQMKVVRIIPNQFHRPIRAPSVNPLC